MIAELRITFANGQFNVQAAAERGREVASAKLFVVMLRDLAAQTAFLASLFGCAPEDLSPTATTASVNVASPEFIQ